MSSPSPHLTLTAVLSAEGLIAGADLRPPPTWASPEDQERFRARVATADWSFVGRLTHGLAFSLKRRRVVFSTRYRDPCWVEERHLWVDPQFCSWEEIMERIQAQHPLQEGLILGGTRVHDWFWERGLIDRFELTLETVRLKAGLPLFSGIPDPLAALAAAGYELVEEKQLNERGSRWVRWEKPDPAR